MARSKYRSDLNAEQGEQLERRLQVGQGGRCFIGDDRIDLVLHEGQLDIDHIDPLIEDGLDSESEFYPVQKAIGFFLRNQPVDAIFCKLSPPRPCCVAIPVEDRKNKRHLEAG